MANQNNNQRAAGAASPSNRSDFSPRSINPSDELHDITPTGNRIVVGIFDRQAQAEEMISQLEQDGFTREDISIIMQQPGTRTEAGAGKTKAHEGTVVGVSAGAVLGGVAGLAALAIPGIGPLLAAGPIAAALGAMGGAALGGLVGSFTGLGIPSEEAKQFDAAVRAGQAVVAVKVADRRAEERAQAIMQHYHPRSVGSYNQAP
jgi:uncharacterized membrane protein